MSSTTSKRQRYARAQAYKRMRALGRLARLIDRERMRRTPLLTGALAGLDGIRPHGWPYGGGYAGSIGGRSRANELASLRLSTSPHPRTSP